MVRADAVRRGSTILFSGLALMGALAPFRAASAQLQIPDKFENLQVLPKDIPKDTLVGIMRGFAMSLGVRCNFCHVEKEGGGAGGPPQFDFKADDKHNKKVARVMLKMVDSINNKLLVLIPDRDTPPTGVGCVTCHRGLNKPRTTETLLLTTIARSGVDSAIARYRSLRVDMTRGQYDFTEQPVSEAANKLAAQGKYDDAIKLLQMVQEFYPNSVNLDFQLAQTYTRKGDKDAAVARLRAVLTKNPNDRRAQQMLQQLGVQP